MTPILVVSAAAVLGLTICNLAWSQYARVLRARGQLNQSELITLRGEVSDLPRLRSELTAVTLRVQDLTRDLFPGGTLPGTPLSCLDQVESSIEAHRKANRVIRRQLSRTVDRLRESQKEIQRLQKGQKANDPTRAMRALVRERDALRTRLKELKASLEHNARDDRAQLLKARKELEDMRLQLRGAYRAIADLESHSTEKHPLLDGGEPTEMMYPAASSEFELM